MDHLRLENCNSDSEHSCNIFVWEDVSNEWNDPTNTITTESFTNNLHPDFILPQDIPHRSVTRLANATPDKCEAKFNAAILFLNHIITDWEASGQGKGGHIDVRPEWISHQS